MSIVVVGATFVDYKGYSLETYIPKGRNKGYIEIKHGGVVRNVSENIAKMGGQVQLISLVNPDATGNDVIHHLNEVGVDTSLIKRIENGMGCWLAVFDESNDVVSSISSRPDLTPLVEVIHNNESVISNCDALFLEMDIDEAVVDLVFSLAKQYHKPLFGIVSNISIMSQRLNYIKQTACFVCNLQEASQLFKTDLESLDIESLIKVCMSKKLSKMMVITLGSKGAIYLSDKESGYIEADTVDVVDTTGAGDGFFSGLCYSLLQGKSLKDACIAGKNIASKVIQSKESVI